MFNIPEKFVNSCRYYDYKGNAIPTYSVKTRLNDWEIFKVEECGAFYNVYIVPTIERCEEWFASLKRKCNNILVEEGSIEYILNLPHAVTMAWLWGCAYHSITQREKPCDSKKYYWVCE